MASRRSPTSAEIESIAANAAQQALIAMEVDETSLEVADGTKASLRCILGSKQTMDSGRSGLLSIMPYLDDLHEMKNINWAATIHEYLISGVKAFETAVACSKTIFLTGCVPVLGFSDLKEGRKRGQKEEGDEKKRKEEAKKRKVEEEQRKRKEEEAERKKEEEEQAEKKKKRKEEEDQRKRKEEEDEQRKKKEQEEDQRKKKDEEDEQRKKKEEEEAESTRKEEKEEEKKTKWRQISPSSLSRRVAAGTRIRRQPELYTPEDFRYHKATKVNVSTFEPIYVDCQESTDTLPRGKIEERRDYVARDFMFNGTLEGYENFPSFNGIWELLFARERESVVIDCYVNIYLFLPREENPDIFLNFGYVGATLKGYVQSCRDDKSKEQHFNYAFGKLDRATNEFDLLFSPMHVGTNHWALLVIHIKEKEFHVYDSLRNKLRCDIPQYVEELKRYLKGKHIDAEKWPLRYPDPCPQQGSGDDCGIFTCKYMECLARRDIQDLPFSQDDMHYVRAKFALHFIKAYFNAQEHS
ncbi:hypothetical protein Taro_049307 [Colocasia esculenta]|uniref:Ubiquitin-like protease family profile domain-containing protein n=1 Tax=Colocasia esculenta TaxID=4460 RepID=A0A843XAK5_COLES|nr:hypothetical protein [Colocasia esculenta]